MIRVSRFAALSVALVLGASACGGSASGDQDTAGEPPEAPGEAAASTEWGFVLRAATDTLWALEEDRSAQPGWIRVRGPGAEGASVSLRERCEIPECGADPAVCGMAMPTVARLAPGDSLVWGWDGLTSRVEESPDRCEVREPAPAGVYTVEVCWTTEAPAEAETPMDLPTLTGVRCEAREIEVPGGGQVRWGG